MKNRNKKIGIIVAGAAALSVGSVGFASWVISGGDSADFKNIGVNVATISDERISLTAPSYTNICVPDGTGDYANVSSKTLVDKVDSPTTAYVVFGPDSSDTSGLIQASGTGQNDIGHLSVSFTFKMTCGDKNEILIKRLSKINITPKYPAVLTSLATSGFIYNPSSTSDTKVELYDAADSSTTKYEGTAKQTYTISGTNTGNFTMVIGEATAGSADVTITANWKWGSVFSGKDPGSLDDNQSSADSVISQIGSMNSMISNATDKNVSFTVEVTANQDSTTTS